MFLESCKKCLQHRLAAGRTVFLSKKKGEWGKFFGVQKKGGGQSFFRA